MNTNRVKVLLTLVLMVAPLSWANQEPCLEKTENSKPETIATPKIQHVFWDLNGVLFKTSRAGMGGEIGFGKLIWYTITHFRNPGSRIKGLAFKVLDGAEVTIEIPTIDGVDLTADGMPMPKLMRAWTLGIMTGDQIISCTLSQINRGQFNYLFSSRSERHLVKRLIATMFNPETLAKHTYVLEEGLKILLACEKQGMINWVLSNRASDVIDAISKTDEGKRVFTHFAPEHILVSGRIHKMKPDPQLYAQIIRENNLAPETCLVIDDEAANINAAKSVGCNTIQIKNGNFKALGEELRKFGITQP